MLPVGSLCLRQAKAPKGCQKSNGVVRGPGLLRVENGLSNVVPNLNADLSMKAKWCHASKRAIGIFSSSTRLEGPTMNSCTRLRWAHDDGRATRARSAD